MVVGTSLLRMTLTGRVVWDQLGRTTQLLPLAMVVLVSLVKLVEQTFHVHKRAILQMVVNDMFMAK